LSGRGRKVLKLPAKSKKSRVLGRRFSAGIQSRDWLQWKNVTKNFLKFL
jgi:hypothetical protein